MSTQAPCGIPVSTLHPKYLNSNSTSHTWPFGAIAELVDNAYDPDVNAKQFWIDKSVIKYEDCLTFMDNGNGMDYETMHKMLSFGYSDKVAKSGKAPIGQYGNGFKSGSMRLGKDVIVFSKSKVIRCVGMLSQTYLKETRAQQIVVPIVCFEKSGSDKFTVSDEQKASLQEILHYSPFKTQEELLAEIDTITSFGKNTGTRIIIWNLRRSSVGALEFDFETDPSDVRLQKDFYDEPNDTSQSPAVKSHVPDMVYSLRAYCRILFLKPRMQIIIRGQNVKSELIAKSLALTRKDTYTPSFLKKSVPITFGYNTRSKEQYGAMMYHKNRLIKAYEHVGCQLRAQSKGVGVIAVIECDFLEPTHNKQEFLASDKYRKTIFNLGLKLEEYWEEIRYKRKTENPEYGTEAVEDTIKRPDQNWVQCDSCQKWRKLPDGVDCNKLPDKWFCRLNPDPQFRNCEVEEDPDHIEDEQPYRKTYKKQQKNKKIKKKQESEEPPLVIDQVAAENKSPAGREDRLKRKLFEKPELPPSTPTTNDIEIAQKETVTGASADSFLPPALNADCSQGSPDLTLVIADIYSLATPQQRQKRPKTGQTLKPSKKLKVVASPEAPEPQEATNVNPKVSIFNQSKHMEERKGSQICRQIVPSDSEDAAKDHAVSNPEVTTRVRLENLSPSAIDVMEGPSYILQSPPLNSSPNRPLQSQEEEVTKERSVEPTLNPYYQQMPPKIKVEQEMGFTPPSLPPPPPPPHGEELGRHSNFYGSISPFLVQIEQLKKERNSLQEQVHQLTLQLQENKESSPGVTTTTTQTDLRVKLQIDSQQVKVENEGTCSRPQSRDPLVNFSLNERLRSQVEEVTKERNSLQEQVHQLTRQLQEAQPVEVQCSCAKEGLDYKRLFEKAQQRVDELLKEKEAAQATVEKVTQIQCQGEGSEPSIDRLLVELNDCRNKRNKVLSECEQLKLTLKQAEDARRAGSEKAADF